LVATCVLDVLHFHLLGLLLIYMANMSFCLYVTLVDCVKMDEGEHVIKLVHRLSPPFQFSHTPNIAAKHQVTFIESVK